MLQVVPLGMCGFEGIDPDNWYCAQCFDEVIFAPIGTTH